MQAGLTLLTASTRDSHLITPSDDGSPVKKKVDVHALLYEGDLRENLVMEPGDTLFIPATFLAKTMRIINLGVILILLVTVAGYSQSVPQGINYQAVARDNTGKEFPNTQISLEIERYSLQDQRS